MAEKNRIVDEQDIFLSGVTNQVFLVIPQVCWQCHNLLVPPPSVRRLDDGLSAEEGGMEISSAIKQSYNNVVSVLQ